MKTDESILNNNNASYFKNMNKKQLQLKAGILLKQWQEIEGCKRGGSNYNNQNWHAVNVKRHNDYIDIDNLLKDYPRQYREELKNSVCDKDGDIRDQIYWDWLDSMRDQLVYEIGDIENVTKGSKRKHKNFEHIALQGEIRKEDYKTKCDTCGRKTWYENEQPCHIDKCAGTLKKITYKQEWDERIPIYFLGRSGGWACFQDTLGEYVEDTLSSIINWDFKNNVFDISEEGDVDYYLTKVDDAIEEITYIKNYIADFNKSLEFRKEIEYMLNESLEEIKETERIKKEDLNSLTADIKKYADYMQKRLDEHKKHADIKNKIQRHLTGIKKIM